MTISVKNPTPGDTYHFYEIVNGKHIVLGVSKTGKFTPTAISRGTHYYVVKVERNGVLSTLDSNEVTYRKKRK